MNLKRIKRSYFVELLSIAFVSVSYCMITLYGFIDNPAMKNDKNSIGGFLFFAILFVFSLLGLFFKWGKMESINIDGIRYKLYRKNIFVFLCYTGFVDASILMIVFVIVSFFANIVDYYHLSLDGILGLLLIYWVLMMLESYSNFKKYKTLDRFHIFTLFLCLFPWTGKAQTSIESLADSLQQEALKRPSELVYLQTGKGIYETGEAEVHFYCSDINTGFIGIVEGVDGAGLLGNANCEFRVIRK